MNLNSDIGKAFEKLKSATFVRYRGCLCERVGQGLVWGKNYYPTEAMCYQAIDKSLGEFKNNVVKPK